MAIKDLDVAYEHLPNLFDRRHMPSTFDDDFFTIPIDDPDRVNPPPTPLEDPSTPRDIDDYMADDLDQDIPPDPLGDLTVQNTRLSNDFMCDQLRRFFAYGPEQLSLENPTISVVAAAQ